jgi:tetratricopeptide (TPR) repeat protein
MKKILITLFTICIAQTFAAKATPEQWIAKANGVLKEQPRISSKYIYPGLEPSSVFEASAILDSATKEYPYRIDMWLGQVQLFGEINECGMQSKFFDKINTLLKKKKDKCELSGGRKIDDAEKLLEKEFTLVIRKYFELEYDSCFEIMSRQMYKYLPNSVEALNFLSIHYMLQKNDSALALLERANKIAPTDCIVLSNLALYYKRKGDAKKEDEYKKKQDLFCKEK